jgi:hypothetical protein
MGNEIASQTFFSKNSKLIKYLKNKYLENQQKLEKDLFQNMNKSEINDFIEQFIKTWNK